MKKYLISSIVAAAVLCSCAQPKQQTGYRIDGEIAGVAGKVYLTVFEGKLPRVIDSAEVKNGAFEFSGDCAVPIFAAVETPDVPLVRFFLENSPMIRIVGTADRPQDIRVTGSATEDLYRQFLGQADSVAKLLDSDSVKLSSTRIAFDLEKQRDSLGRVFVRKHSGSVAAAYVLFRGLSYEMSAKEIRQALDGLTPPASASVYAELLEKMVAALARTEPGQKYVDISVPDTAGVELPLSRFVGEGKYVLLDFWASWCPPCRAEIPNLVTAYKEFHSKGFEIYAVSLDKNRKAWLDGIKMFKMDWPQVGTLKFWESAAAETYGVRSIPSNVLIGPDGTILARNLMGSALLQKLGELLVPQPSKSAAASENSAPAN